MKINGFIDGAAIFRMPRELNDEIADLPISVTSLSEIKTGESVELAVKYGFMRISQPDNSAEHDTVSIAHWTDFGLAIAKNFRSPRVLRNRVYAPPFRLSALLDVIPAHVRDGLLSDPPVLDSGPGAFFTALGVCDRVRGEWFLTHFGRRAMAGYRIHQMSGSEDMILLHDFFSPPVSRYMRRVLNAGPGGLRVLGDNGLPQHKDRRELRPFNDENAAVLLTKEVINPDYAKQRMMWVHYISPDMIPFVAACTEDVPRARSALEILQLLPEKDRFAFMKEFAVGDTQRANIFVRLGWVTRRHGGLFAYSKIGAKHAVVVREEDARIEEDAALMRRMEFEERRANYVPLEEPTLDDIDQRLTALEEQVGIDPFDLFNADEDGYATDPTVQNMEPDDDPFDIL